MVVIPRRGGVASSIALATRLDPDESILEGKTRVSGGTGTKSLFLLVSIFRSSGFKFGRAELESQNKTNGTYSSDGIAPISPCSLTCGLLSRTTLVGDEVSVEALGAQERGKGLDIERFIIVGVAYKS